MNLSLRTQLIIFSLVLMGINIIIGIAGLKGMSETDKGLEKVYAEGVVQIERLKEISDDYAVFIIDAVNKANAGILKAEDATSGIREAGSRIKNNWHAYSSIKPDPEEEKLISEANSLFKTADKAVDDLLITIGGMKGDVSGQLGNLDGSLYKNIDPITEKISEIAKYKIKAAENIKDLTDKRYSGFKMAVVFLIFSGLSFALAIGFSVMKSGTRLMTFTVKSMREVSSKNISMDVPESMTKRKDETGTVARAINRLLTSMREIIRELSENAAIVSASSAELEKTSENLSESADEMNQKLRSVASGSESLSGNVNDMARASESISEESGNVAAAVEEMSVSIKEVAMNCAKNAEVARNADEQTGLTLKIMSELNDYAEEIGKVVEVIDSIADQTNMLALNATIEAARAGEAGKGFAVVANEVKDLAHKSRQSTGEIAVRIEKIRSGSGSVMKSIQNISEIIKHLNEISSGIAAAVEEQNATTNEIARNVASVSSQTGRLSSGVRSSAMIADESTKNIHSISKESEKVASFAKTTRDSAVGLADLAAKLNKIVIQFKLQ